MLPVTETPACHRSEPRIQPRFKCDFLNIIHLKKINEHFGEQVLKCVLKLLFTTYQMLRCRYLTPDSFNVNQKYGQSYFTFEESPLKRMLQIQCSFII